MKKKILSVIIVVILVLSITVVAYADCKGGSPIGPLSIRVSPRLVCLENCQGEYEDDEAR